MIRNRPLTFTLAAIVAAGLVSGAGAQAPEAPTAPAVAFTDVTAQAGITFRHNSGAFGKKYLPETMGAGVVVLDVDNDGLQDLFFVNGRTWPGPAGGPQPAGAVSQQRRRQSSPTSPGRRDWRSRRTGWAPRPPTTTTTDSSTCS